MLGKLTVNVCNQICVGMFMRRFVVVLTINQNVIRVMACWLYANERIMYHFIFIHEFYVFVSYMYIVIDFHFQSG